MSAPHGPTVAALDVAGQFVLCALRTRLEGAAKLDPLEEGFRLAQDGVIGVATLAAFETWFEVLADHCGGIFTSIASLALA